MNWGKSIILAFVLFAGFIATLVVVCVREDVSLVSKDYYKDELAYQDQIRRLNNTNALNQKPTIQKVGNSLEIRFNQFSNMEKGVLKLFRPSDSTMDRVFALKAENADTQSFPIDDLQKGMYKARMQWQMDGKEYYIEATINI